MLTNPPVPGIPVVYQWYRFLNVKVLAGTFNQEKALVGAFSVIVKYSRRFV